MEVLGIQLPEHFGLNLLFTREYLKAGVFVSLVTVWVLVALFYYLNRYTKRRYFTIWTVAWLFYALWITLSFGVRSDNNLPILLMGQQWCIGVSAMFLLWGSSNFLNEPVRQSVMAWFLGFLTLWSYYGAYHLSRPLELELPVFTLISAASIITAVSFFNYRRRHPYIGATLLTLGFFLWGVYMACYPFLEISEDLTSLALFISAGLQLMLAVSMIILVLEEARQSNHDALQQVQTGKAERAALQSRVNSTEQRYQKLFDNASEAILITDAEDFHILELNVAAEKMLGISHSDAPRHSLTAFCQIKSLDGLPPRDSDEWFQTLCRQRPLNLVRLNGSIVPVEVNGTQIQFDGRSAYQFFVLEVTERARLEQQLRQAEKLSAIGQMISGIAHELNNPLSVVKGYIELVLSHHDLSAQTRADLEKAAAESHRAAKLVMNFLSFAREQPAHRETVDVNQLIENVVELRHFDLVVAKTDLTLELEPGLPCVFADPDQVHQILTNLISNALHAMVDLQKPGCLMIKTALVGETVRVMVEDNGPGVPPHLLDKIFEPFFTTKDVGAGTGLGLSIAHSLMAEHKGKIIYQPSSLGGAGFVLDFPMNTEPRPQPKCDSPTTFLARAADEEFSCSGNVLVLDDEKSIADMIGEMLTLLGYRTTICNLATQALEKIDGQDFDLIISDFRMPGINGRQFFNLAIQKKPELATRIIFLTGDIVNTETQEFLKSTGNPHIGKPFNLNSVKKVVAEAIESNQLREVVGV
jgi:PAS domain S-box-containing protein